MRPNHGLDAIRCPYQAEHSVSVKGAWGIGSGKGAACFGLRVDSSG